MDDHDEQYRTFTNHSLILPPLCSLLRLLDYRPKGNQVKTVFSEKKSSIFRFRPLAASEGRQPFGPIRSFCFILKIHSFHYLPFTVLVIRYLYTPKRLGFVFMFRAWL